MANQYTILRYVPDLVKGEFVNLAVVLLDERGRYREAREDPRPASQSESAMKEPRITRISRIGQNPWNPWNPWLRV